MKVFHCGYCDQPVFFENTRCVNCEHTLAFLPDLMDVGALEPADDERWVSELPTAQGHTYRLCRNYREAQVCNWAATDADPNPLCESCRLTAVIPNLDTPGPRDAWYRLEVAKRRVIYTLMNLGLPIGSEPNEDVPGLEFRFLADSGDGQRVLTGHANGVITINVAEADDAERERRRRDLGEPYRTLLGHFRHEVGHYYWMRLITERPRLDAFRALFGDDRDDYASALQRHYRDGPQRHWQQRFVSAYASTHPWEDWAETWAHYLHMTDTLETAAACGVSVRPRRPGERSVTQVPASAGAPTTAFDRLIASWHPLTYGLNNLNRGMGLANAYPFVLSAPAIEKLRFVHETVGSAAIGNEGLGFEAVQTGCKGNSVDRSHTSVTGLVGTRGLDALETCAMDQGWR